MSLQCGIYRAICILSAAVSLTALLSHQLETPHLQGHRQNVGELFGLTFAGAQVLRTHVLTPRRLHKKNVVPPLSIRDPPMALTIA